MTKSQFDYLCETYGDPNLPAEDKWKSVCYIATTTTKVPTFSFQHYLLRNKIAYSDKIGEPGFFITDYQPAQSGVFNNSVGMITTFIPLRMITAITVTRTSAITSSEDPDNPDDDKDDVIIETSGAEDTGTESHIMDGASADPNAVVNVIYDGYNANTL